MLPTQNKICIILLRCRVRRNQCRKANWRLSINVRPPQQSVAHKNQYSPSEQSQKADAIIREAHSEMKGIRDKAESDVDVVREKARNEMRAMLTPEQKARFEAMVQRMDEERKKAQQMAPAR